MESNPSNLNGSKAISTQENSTPNTSPHPQRYQAWNTELYNIQGSILGPLLFNLLMNDITKACNEVKMVIYENDTNVFCTLKSLNSLYSIIY